MRYAVIFDVRNATAVEWPLIAGAVLAFAIGVALFRSNGGSTAIRYLALTLPLIAAPGMIAGSIMQHRSLVQALNEHSAEQVAGRVQGFHPGNGGHEREYFKVAGRSFCYGDAVITGGFNRTSAGGGPIHEGLQVRIWHVEGTIVRLEILR